MANLSLLNNFCDHSSDVIPTSSKGERKRRIHRIRLGRSLWSAISCPAQESITDDGGTKGMDLVVPFEEERLNRSSRSEWEEIEIEQRFRLSIREYWIFKWAARFGEDGRVLREIRSAEVEFGRQSSAR